MASNLLTDVKIGRGRKKSNHPSSSKTKLGDDFTLHRPITRSQNRVHNNPQLSGQCTTFRGDLSLFPDFARLLKDPIYSDLLDQMLKDSANIEESHQLLPLYYAFLGESPSQFDVEAYCLAHKRVLDNPQLVANRKRLKTAYFELRSIPEERVTHTMDSPASNIVLDKIKTGVPNAMKRKFTVEETLVDMFVKYTDTVTSDPKSKLVSSADINKAGWHGRTALHEACGNGKVKIAKVLLTLKGIVVNALDDDGNTALHYAAGYGFEKCVKLLLRRGADVKLKSVFGKTPFDLAMLKNHTSVVDVMKKLREKEVDEMMQLRENEVES